MAVTFIGKGNEYKIGEGEKQIYKFIIDTDTLDGATVSSASGTFGTSRNITANTALSTSATVSSPNIFLTVTTAEINAMAEGECVLGCLATLSDTRILGIRLILDKEW